MVVIDTSEFLVNKDDILFLFSEGLGTDFKLFFFFSCVERSLCLISELFLQIIGYIDREISRFSPKKDNNVVS